MLPKEAHSGVWLLKDMGKTTPLLGCGSCLDRATCGGLHLPNGTSTLTCMDLCQCADPNACDLICPNVPKRYAKRFSEVSGFDFDDIPHRRFKPLPKLQEHITLVEGRIGKARPIEMPLVAIPLSHAIRGRGELLRAKTKDELIRDHGISPKMGWVLTGTEDDRYVERIWKLPNHRTIFKNLVEAGAVFATSPNFSLYADVPRHDNLHAMKRIAWMWYLMNEAGLPTALHVNGRTDFDFERWAQFIVSHTEVTAIAFEFLTGAKSDMDSERYIGRLASLQKCVGRPLTLVLRGSTKIAHQLEKVFNRVILLDATPYFRAVHRHAAMPSDDAVLRYKPRGGNAVAPFGRLFKELTVAAERRYQRFRLEVAPAAQQRLDLRPVVPADMGTNDESPQMSLFPFEPPT